jgi:hypothetical protein
MRHVTGQKEHFARPERNNLALTRLRYIMAVELALQLEKNFFSLINVKLLAGSRPFMDHRNEIGMLPRRSTRAPVFPILFDPLFEIERKQRRKSHNHLLQDRLQ